MGEGVCVCGSGGEGCSFHASHSTVYHDFSNISSPISSPVEASWTTTGYGEALGVG